MPTNKQGYSQYFTFEELTDSDNHKELVPQNRIDAEKFSLAGKRLSKLLESIRTLLGSKPMTVSSGFRNNTLNKAVGSTAKNSAHLRFEAADVIPTSMSVADAFNTIMRNKDKLPDMKKCIVENIGGKKWLHVQVSMKSGEKQEFYSTTDGINYTPVKA